MNLDKIKAYTFNDYVEYKNFIFDLFLLDKLNKIIVKGHADDIVTRDFITIRRQHIKNKSPVDITIKGLKKHYNLKDWYVMLKIK